MAQGFIAPRKKLTTIVRGENKQREQRHCLKLEYKTFWMPLQHNCKQLLCCPRSRRQARGLTWGLEEALLKLSGEAK